MKDWRPQVLVGLVALCAIGIYAMMNGFEQIAGICATGIVGVATLLARDGKSGTP
ncbi:unnamed protein product [marine sediment metagenome]|uniref:Uncharacterized protein n=1 Tax=marine sediment metagenome TaxID=412755 RepID=X0TIT2_9ZZZZ